MKYELPFLIVLPLSGGLVLSTCNKEVRLPDDPKPDPPAPPNIVLITLDDVGQQFGFMGDHTVPTPNVDKLANDNVVFRNAYVTHASSSPSRSSLFTGLYTHQNGQLGLAHRGFRMFDNTLTIPTILHDNGYRTGILGKVHVSPEDAAFVFDMKYNPGDMYTQKVKSVAGKAREFIIQSGRTPFFLKISYADCHDPMANQINDSGELIPALPITASEIMKNAWTGNTIAEENKQKFAEYYNGIQRIDYGIGLLLKVLEETGKSDHTLIIFLTGDNGGGPVNGGKMNIYETSNKTPIIIRYPGVQKSKQVRNELVSSIDVIHTVLEAAGVALPQSVAQKSEGRTLMPLVRGETPAGFRKHLFTEMTYHGPELYRPCRAVRDERYKLTLYYPDNLPVSLKTENPAITADYVKYMSEHPEMREQIVSDMALYDLDTYPNKIQSDGTNLLTNGTSSDPVILAKRNELLAALEAWQYRTNDQLLRAGYVPVKQ